MIAQCSMAALAVVHFEKKIQCFNILRTLAKVCMIMPRIGLRCKTRAQKKRSA